MPFGNRAELIPAIYVKKVLSLAYKAHSTGLSTAMI